MNKKPRYYVIGIDQKGHEIALIKVGFFSFIYTDVEKYKSYIAENFKKYTTTKNKCQKLIEKYEQIFYFIPHNYNWKIAEVE